jgi:hypothetical protein
MDALSARSSERYWEPWLAAWRMNCLMLAAPWDAALRAFAERAELMPRRMAALDLDPDAVAHNDPAAFGDLLGLCAACESPELCEWHLRQDPDDPAWQDYCPNAPKLRVLAGRIRRPM